MLHTLPYAALRTLEAVVRLEGFGRAAEELGVTQSAVSQHVKALEDWTGHRLLTRGGRGATATEAGRRLAAAVAEGFGTVEAACAELRDRGRGPRPGVTVAAPPGFAYVWMLPRLLDFDEAHPETPVSLVADALAGAEDADLAIRYGAGGFAGLHAERLMGERLSPVCAPALLPELRDVADLARQTVLIDDLPREGDPPSWRFWAEECGLRLPAFGRTRRFGQANMSIQAAIKGVGVAMGRSPLVVDALREGALARPFPHEAASQLAYWLVCRRTVLRDPRVAAFRDWLLAEVARDPALAAG